MLLGRTTLRLCGVAIAAAATAGFAWPASAQLAGVRGALGGGVGQILRTPSDVLSQPLSALDPSELLTLHVDRLNALVRAHPKALERDEHGAPVVRGQVLAVAPTAQSLMRAREAGFEVIAPDAGDGDGSETGVVVLASPAGLSAREAVKRLRKLDPAGTYDYNHLYLPAASATSTASAGSLPPADTPPAEGVRIGLIDTGVDEAQRVFAGARIDQRGFAKGGAKPAAHGTQVASLLIGAAPSFHGAVPGAALFVADVYGADPAGGSADDLVRALFWLAGRRVQVVNVSLVGPPNAALGAGIKALAARGILVVAAVGNDGPAAPPSYPASYPGVVAVTGVDARGVLLFEAGRSEHLDFAAPGADVAAASISGGFDAVRGTSFASPLVAGLLARLAANPDATARSPVDVLASQARHGRGYGRGLVGMELRTPPAAVHARAAGSD